MSTFPGDRRAEVASDLVAARVLHGLPAAVALRGGMAILPRDPDSEAIAAHTALRLEE